MDNRLTSDPPVDVDYARVYSIACGVSRDYGYACHMSVSIDRDLELLLVPWVEDADEASRLMPHLIDSGGLRYVGGEMGTVKPHGRMAWTLAFPKLSDPRFIDISVMPKFLDVSLKPQTTRIKVPPSKVVALERKDPLMWNAIKEMQGLLATMAGVKRLTELLNTMESSYTVLYEDVYTQLCEMIEPHVNQECLPGSVTESVQKLIELCVAKKLLKKD